MVAVSVLRTEREAMRSVLAEPGCWTVLALAFGVAFTWPFLDVVSARDLRGTFFFLYGVWAVLVAFLAAMARALRRRGDDRNV